MADLVFFVILFYALVFGARRGLYKEIVQFVALIVAVLAAKSLYGPVAVWVQLKTGGKLPLVLAEVAAVVLLWIVSFFLVALIGRLILKQLRGSGLDDNLGEGAEAIADALAGDTTKGPVTLLTDPIASTRGLFYWSDKLFGAGLGLFKGLITGYLLFGIVIYADRTKGWDSPFAKSIEQSFAAKAYQAYIEKYLATFPEYRIASSLGDMKAVAEHLKKKKDPRRFKAFVEDPRLLPLRKNKTILELGKDKEIRTAWKDKDLGKLLGNPKVKGLLSDRDVRKLIADIDWKKLRKDVEAFDPNKAPEPKPKPVVKTTAPPPETKTAAGALPDPAEKTEPPGEDGAEAKTAEDPGASKTEDF